MFEASESSVVNKMNRLNQSFASTMQKSGCSQASIDYAKMTLDPFHDSTLAVVGAPDSYTGRSLVYDVRKQITLSKPATIGAQNWDCHIAAVPFMHQYVSGGTSSICVETSNSSFVVPVVDATSAPISNSFAFPTSSPVLVNSVPAGVSTYTNEYAQADAMTGLNILAGLNLNVTDKFRVIGLAFEVNNTTAEINKQGSVTCYRTQSDSEYGNLRGFSKGVTSGTLTPVRQFPLRILQLPPNDVSQAQQLDGVAWKAADGALVPVCIDFDENAPRFYNTENVLYQSGLDWSITFNSNPAIAGKVGWCPSTMFGTSFGTATVSTVVPSGSLSLEIPMMQSGAYFTGLSPATTLTLSVRAFVEVFPAPYSPNYALARPSPAYDDKLSALLCGIQSQLLPGYPASMNAKADFFKNVVGFLGNVYKTGATPLKLALNASPDPRMKAVVASIEGAERVVAAGKAIAKAAKKAKKQTQKTKASG